MADFFNYVVNIFLIVTFRECIAKLTTVKCSGFLEILSYVSNYKHKWAFTVANKSVKAVMPN